MQDPYSANAPYRNPPEKEREPVKPVDWEFRVFVGLGLLLLIGSGYGCNSCREAGEAKAALLRNTCQVEDGDKTFVVKVYDDSGTSYNAKTEGFFTTRREAEEFIKTIPQCEKK